METLNSTAFTLGNGVAISWLQILYSMVFVVLAWYVSRLLALLIVRKILNKTHISPDGKAIIQRIIFFALMILITLSVLTYLGIPLTTFAFISGAVAIGLGFGAKTIVENFISGWVLMKERPIRMGDIIELDGNLGTIKEIGNRSSQVKRIDGAYIVIPNSQLLESRLINWTLNDPYIRTSVRVGVAYGTDVKLLRRLLLVVMAEHELILNDPATVVVFEDFGDSALIFDAFFWVSMKAGREIRVIRSDVRFKVEQIFRDQGVVVSFPQRDVHINISDPDMLYQLAS